MWNLKSKLVWRTHLLQKRSPTVRAVNLTWNKEIKRKTFDGPNAKAEIYMKEEYWKFFWKGQYSNDKLIAEKNLLKTKKITV